ncbi:MAG TPA: hypothetical protein VL688_06720 [Verrucomicrobiae bacterium]|nr:hypothetical protein [Verrucomicrobiae bacterium]
MSHEEEKEIEKIFENYRLKKVPQSLMKDYAAEVRRKIEMTPGPSFPLGALAAFAVGLAFAGTVAFVMLRPHQPALEIKAPEGVSAPSGTLETPAVQGPQAVQPAPSAALAEEEGVEPGGNQEALARELFVLEMLGEDDGVMTDASRFDVEPDFLGPGPA